MASLNVVPKDKMLVEVKLMSSFDIVIRFGPE